MQYYPDDPSQGVPFGRFGNSVFPEFGLQFRRIAAILGDFAFIGPCRSFCQKSIASVYKYRFNATDPFLAPPMFGSCHGAEIEYVFNSPQLRAIQNSSRVMDVVVGSWISFIVDLDPNNHGIKDIPKWEDYSEHHSNFVIQDGNFGMEPDTFREEGIALINEAVSRL